jgi:transcriptional regulator with XRE-family HTH domain
MKIVEREKALELRKEGLSFRDIERRLCVSRGSLSRWLNGVPFVASEEVADRRRLSSIRNGQVLRNRKLKRVSGISNKAKSEIKDISNVELKLLGAMAYWTEGSKTDDSLVKFTNSDPRFIRFALKWLREICNVPEEKLRLHLRLHGDLNREETEEFWSDITGIPPGKFHKTTIKKSESSGRRGNKLKYGVASVIVCDTDLFYRIKGWIEGIISTSGM